VASLSRAEDLVARYDGDEFALMMANASRQIVWQRADLIRQRARSLEIGGNDHQLGPISLSVGIAVFPEDGASTEAVLQAADRALISSRQAGRNGVAVGEASGSPLVG
jgi:diguanylate cyclase (GGDEF)-like protein